MGEGQIHVNAGEDAWDIVEAARINVANELRARQELGFTDAKLEALLAESMSETA